MHLAVRALKLHFALDVNALHKHLTKDEELRRHFVHFANGCTAKCLCTSLELHS